MCYPKPGPRCSSHALKAFAKAHHKCLVWIQKAQESTESFDTQYKQIEPEIEARKRAEEAFLVTPAGLESLRLQSLHAPSEHAKEIAAEKYVHYKQTRAEMLALLGAEDKGDMDNHRRASVEKIYSKLRVHKDYMDPSSTRVGWSIGADDNKEYADALISLSNAWANRLTDEQKAIIYWYASGASSELGKPGYLDDKPELRKQISNLNEAIKIGPKFPEPVVLYHGINSHVTLDIDAIKEVGSYELPRITSATPNPGVANSFGYGEVILEIKTRYATSTAALCPHGAKEEEILLPQGARYRLVGVQENVKFKWPARPSVNYTVLRLEEI